MTEVIGICAKYPIKALRLTEFPNQNIQSKTIIMKIGICITQNAGFQGITAIDPAYAAEANVFVSIVYLYYL